jgi:arylsulfatase A-like enzyme
VARRLSSAANSARAEVLVTALVVFGLSSPLLTRWGDSARVDAGTPVAEPRRVILIVVDTLRYDALSCDVEEGQRTPSSLALARDGIVFEGAHTPAPWTLPSVCSLLTGLSPSVHLAVKPETALPGRVPTLAERLSAAGVRTAAFGENGFLKPHSHLSRGFDEYTWFPREGPAPLLGAKLVRRALGRRFRDEADASWLTELACDWIGRHSAEDSFLWLHYFDPHVPYAPPPELQPRGAPPARIGRAFVDPQEVRLGLLEPTPTERQWIRDLYAGEVRYFDRELGRLVACLEERGLYESTSIVLTADHGEELWDHDGFEHGHTVYEELLHVPLVIKTAGSAPHGLRGRESRPVSTVSVTPTILSLFGIELDPADFSEPSLLALDPEPRVSVRDHPIFAGGQLYYAQREAVISDGLKYIVRPGNHAEELYRLGEGERVSVADSEPERMAELRVLLEQHHAAAAALRERYGIEGPEIGVLDEATARDLRELGYVK